jgi:Na+-driven multidrug efflux pump
VPLAHVASQYTLLLLLAAYVCCCRHRRPPYDPRTWTGWQLRRAFRGGAVVEFLKLGVPGILSNSEWWFWECTCFMAGELGTATLAAHTVVYTLVPLLFMTPLGLSIGISARVGQLLAEGNVEGAKMVNRAATLIGVATVTTQAIVFFAASDAIIGAFTQDEAVACKCRRIWPLACSYIIFDGTFGVQMGTMRALGLQCRMTVAVTSSLWLIGLPTMYVIRWAERERERETERQRDRETERQRDRETERERERQRDRDQRETRERRPARQSTDNYFTGISQKISRVCCVSLMQLPAERMLNLTRGWFPRPHCFQRYYLAFHGDHLGLDGIWLVMPGERGERGDPQRKKHRIHGSLSLLSAHH